MTPRPGIHWDNLTFDPLFDATYEGDTVLEETRRARNLRATEMRTVGIRLSQGDSVVALGAEFLPDESGQIMVLVVASPDEQTEQEAPYHGLPAPLAQTVMDALLDCPQLDDLGAGVLLIDRAELDPTLDDPELGWLACAVVRLLQMDEQDNLTDAELAEWLIVDHPDVPDEAYTQPEATPDEALISPDEPAAEVAKPEPAPTRQFDSSVREYIAEQLADSDTASDEDEPDDSTDDEPVDDVQEVIEQYQQAYHEDVEVDPLDEPIPLPPSVASMLDKQLDTDMDDSDAEGEEAPADLRVEAPEPIEDSSDSTVVVNMWFDEEGDVHTDAPPEDTDDRLPDFGNTLSGDVKFNQISSALDDVRRAEAEAAVDVSNLVAELAAEMGIDPAEVHLERYNEPERITYEDIADALLTLQSDEDRAVDDMMSMVMGMADDMGIELDHTPAPLPVVVPLPPPREDDDLTDDAPTDINDEPLPEVTLDAIDPIDDSDHMAIAEEEPIEVDLNDAAQIEAISYDEVADALAPDEDLAEEALTDEDPTHTELARFTKEIANEMGIDGNTGYFKLDDIEAHLNQTPVDIPEPDRDAAPLSEEDIAEQLMKEQEEDRKAAQDVQSLVRELAQDMGLDLDAPIKPWQQEIAAEGNLAVEPDEAPEREDEPVAEAPPLDILDEAPATQRLNWREIDGMADLAALDAMMSTGAGRPKAAPEPTRLPADTTPADLDLPEVYPDPGDTSEFRRVDRPRQTIDAEPLAPEDWHEMAGAVGHLPDQPPRDDDLPRVIITRSPWGETPSDFQPPNDLETYDDAGDVVFDPSEDDKPTLTPRMIQDLNRLAKSVDTDHPVDETEDDVPTATFQTPNHTPQPAQTRDPFGYPPPNKIKRTDFGDLVFFQCANCSNFAAMKVALKTYRCYRCEATIEYEPIYSRGSSPIEP